MRVSKPRVNKIQIEALNFKISATDNAGEGDTLILGTHSEVLSFMVGRYFITPTSTTSWSTQSRITMTSISQEATPLGGMALNMVG